MFTRDFYKRPIVENSQKMSVSVFVKHNQVELEKMLLETYSKAIDFRDEDCVQKFIELVEKNIKINLKQEIGGKEEFTEPNDVRLTYTKSNLNRGFIFWFLCNGCGRKVRYLYIPPDSQKLLCRMCHRLAYAKQNKTRDKLVARLVKDENLRWQYMNSGSPRLSLAAFEAQMLLEGFKREAIKRVEKLYPKENLTK